MRREFAGLLVGLGCGAVFWVLPYMVPNMSPEWINIWFVIGALSVIGGFVMFIWPSRIRQDEDPNKILSQKINLEIRDFREIIISIKTWQSKPGKQKSKLNRARNILDSIRSDFSKSDTIFTYRKSIAEVIRKLDLLFQDYCVSVGMLFRKEFDAGRNELYIKKELWGGGPNNTNSIEERILTLIEEFKELLSKEYANNLKDESPRADSLVSINLRVEKYSYPPVNSKTIGITIHNLEKYDLTDICLILLELKKSQFTISSSESINSTLIRTDDYDCNFDLKGDLRIRADNKRNIKLGELRDGQFFFLVKEPFNPESLFQEQNRSIYMPNAVWELKFELDGKIQGNEFSKETFYTRIGVMDKVVHIGEIIHVEQD